MEKVIEFLDANEAKWIDRLSENVAVASISCQPENRPQTIEQMHIADKMLKGLGCSTEMVDIGSHQMHDGETHPLPPIILGKLGEDPNKKTLLIYGHLDVQPALTSDGWDTDPFVLTEKDGKMYGRGSTDDKGPVLGWVNVIESYQKTNTEIPINIKFCLEGMEESGSVGLEELVRKRDDFFQTNVDWVCISDNYFLGKTKPCVTYGLRGCMYFYLEVICAKQDLHSGVFGGSVHEATVELSHLFASMVDVKGKILIDGVGKEVDELTEEEMETYTDIDFDMAAYQADVGTNQLTEDTKAKLLMRRWREPSLSIHGMQGAFAEPGEKTVIPGKVIGKFSIRLVPSMSFDHVEKCVTDHIDAVHAKLGTQNQVKCYLAKGPGKPWKAETNTSNFQAAIKAVEDVWGVKPDLTREGCSIPITLVFEEVTGRSVLLLPMGSSDDGAHSQNEKLNKINYTNGMKVFANYIHRLGKE